MKKDFNIIIAERDRRVREFLCREMRQADYQVKQARNCFELMKHLKGKELFDLLIIDPDFPEVEEATLLAEIFEKFPLLPIIFHTYGLNKKVLIPSSANIYFVEKGGNSIEQLLKNVIDICHNRQIIDTDLDSKNDSRLGRSKS